ncbi:hypothetical protein FO519_001191 [Halicephalobus sp. NKZ332]|nr:hypothetical protein FO519_001191 [Halicephalobus sp. NKZ332]
MYVSCALNSVATIIAIFMVLKHSPKNMGIYKYILLNIVLWSFAMDIIYTLLWMPLQIMPAPGICITGLLSPLGQYNGNGACLLAFIMTYVGCNMSCCHAQFYRVITAKGKSTMFFSYPWMIAITVLSHILPATPGIFAYLYALELDDEALKDYFVKNFPNIRFIVENLPCGGFIIDGNHEKWKIFFGTCFFCLSGCLCLSAGMLTYILKTLKRVLKNSVSMKSAQLQRQLILTLVVQSCLPSICLGLPYLMTVLASMVGGNTLSEISTLLVAVGSLHSFFHTIVLILMIQPYKLALSNLVCKNQSQVDGASYKTPSNVKFIRNKHTVFSINLRSSTVN